MDNEKVFAMPFSRAYGCLTAKAERKGRTKEEVDRLTTWLTGYDENELTKIIDENVTYRAFFDSAPRYNPCSENITGSICGIKVQEIEDPLMRKIRQLDKLVDELARGKSVDRILEKLENPAEKKNSSRSKKSSSVPETIDEYICMQPSEVRPILQRTAETLRTALPECQEKISYRMPTFWKKRNIIHFAASKNHLGIYPGPDAIIAFSEQLSDYKTSKGAIQFPYKKEIPYDLIAAIGKWSLAHNSQ